MQDTAKLHLEVCLKKNQTTPRPSEHPPVMGEKMSYRSQTVFKSAGGSSAPLPTFARRVQRDRSGADTSSEDVGALPDDQDAASSDRSATTPGKRVGSDSSSSGIMRPSESFLWRET